MAISANPNQCGREMTTIVLFETTKHVDDMLGSTVKNI